MGVHVRQSLQQFANELVGLLKRRAPKSSGNLAKSFDSKVDDDSIEIEGSEYAKYIDKGVQGKNRKIKSEYGFGRKKPPISALMGLSKRSGINVYALQNSIFEKGIRPTFFMSKGLDNEYTEFSDELAEAVWEDFVDQVNETVNKQQ